MDAYNRALAAQDEAATLAGWQAPLWDMGAPPGGAHRCLYVHVCWPCAAGDIAARTHGVWAIDAICGGVLGCFFCFYCVPWALTRQRLRNADSIDGNLACDCLVTTALPPCYLAQALNHMELRDSARTAAALARAPISAARKPPGVVAQQVMAS
jgi:hypothetical protein